MKLYSSILLVASLSSFVQATTLKEMIDATLQKNENLKALHIETDAKQKNYESVSNSFKPSVVVGAKYTRLDLDTRAVQVGSTGVGFAKFELNLYDGGKGEALKEEKYNEFYASKFSSKATTKDTLFELISLYFQARTIIENIKVFQEKAKTLQAQYQRVQTKYEIKMTTIDEVLKLKSEYESNQYMIDDLSYQKEELFANLSLLSSLEITSLDSKGLPDVKELSYQKGEDIQSLEYAYKASKSVYKELKAIKLPQLKLEDTLSVYSYDEYNHKLLTDLPDTQNQLNLTLTYNLYDTTSSQKIASSKLQALSLSQKLSYTQKKAKMKFRLAKKKLYTQKKKIHSLKSALDMGESVYEMVNVKYKNGLVDNITYLDALSKKTYNEALYKQALNEYEITKAAYFLSSGVDFHTLIKSW